MITKSEWTMLNNNSPPTFSLNINQRYGIAPEIHGFVDFIKGFMKNLDEIQKNKADIESSAATWKTDRFERYFPIFKISFVAPFHPQATFSSLHGPSVSHDAFSCIQEKILANCFSISGFSSSEG